MNSKKLLIISVCMLVAAVAASLVLAYNLGKGSAVSEKKSKTNLLPGFEEWSIENKSDANVKTMKSGNLSIESKQFRATPKYEGLELKKGSKYKFTWESANNKAVIKIYDGSWNQKEEMVLSEKTNNECTFTAQDEKANIVVHAVSYPADITIKGLNMFEADDKTKDANKKNDENHESTNEEADEPEAENNDSNTTVDTDNSGDSFDTGYFTDKKITDYSGENVYFLSSKGSDSNDGKYQKSAFATLERYKKVVNEGNFSESTLYVEDGYYNVDKQFTIDGRFASTTKIKIIGIGNKAIFTQSKIIDKSKMTETNLNGKKCYRVDISGLTDFTQGFTSMGTSTLQNAPFLMINGARMKYSEYPKGSQIALSTDDLGKVKKEAGGYYVTVSDKDRATIEKIKDFTGAVMEGTPGGLFYTYVSGIKSYNASNGTLHMNNIGIGELGAGGAQSKGVVYIIRNAKELLTNPGEYYVDFAKKELYVILPDSLDKCELSFVNGATIGNGAFRADSSLIDSNDYAADLKLTIEKINFSGMNSSCFEGNLSGVNFNRCRFSGIKGNAIASYKSKNVNVNKCRFSMVTGYNVLLNNGTYVSTEKAQKSRVNLVACNNKITNCVFNYNGYMVDMGSHNNPINMLTVGAVAKNNKIQNSVAIAINYQYNDNLIEANEIKNPCYLTGDEGAIYSGRDLTSFGNIVKKNHIYGYTSPEIKSRWIIGIYMDDCNSGNTIDGNIIEGAGWGIYLPGGSYNTVINNTLKNCGEPIRATDFWYNYPAAVWASVKMRLQKIYPNYQSELWKKKYPQITNVLDGRSIDAVTAAVVNAKPDFIKPRGNVVKNNVFEGCDKDATFDPQFRANAAIGGNEKK